MILNWHAHVYPPARQTAPEWQGRCPMTIENLLRIHDGAGVDMAVVSNPIHYVKGQSAEATLAAIQEWDEYAATLQQRYPDRLVGFASSVPGGGDAVLKELERAIRDYGLRGVLINSSHNGAYPDEDNARGFFELVTALDVPVMVHAPAYSFGEECMRMYRLVSSVGRASDECLALARMIVRGIWEQFPTLKLVGAHLGGGICEVIGRMNYAYELQDEAFFLGSYAPMKIKHPPSHYLKKMYLDTVTYNPPAVRMVLDWMGADRVLYGSDAPPLTSLKPRAIQLIRDLDIPEGDREQIFWRNAARLLKLPLVGALAA